MNIHGVGKEREIMTLQIIVHLALEMCAYQRIGINLKVKAVFFIAQSLVYNKWIFSNVSFSDFKNS
jgi:hypothetical protein